MQTHLEQLGAELIGYGPADRPVAMAEDFGTFEAEYAAIRRHVGILHLPQTGLIKLTGSDVKPFLQNMLSQDIEKMQGGQTRRALQLDAEGRVLADLFVHLGDASTWLEMDRFDIDAVTQLLDSRLFAEDVTHENITETRTAIALLGPAALQLLSKVAKHSVPEMQVEQVGAMPGTHHVLEVGWASRPSRSTADGPDGHPTDPHQTRVSACRRDLGKTLGLQLFVPSEQAVAIHQSLLDAAGYEPGVQPDADFAERRRDSFAVGQSVGRPTTPRGSSPAERSTTSILGPTRCQPRRAKTRSTRRSR